MTTPLTDFDLHLWAEGTHDRAYDKFGAHPATENGVAGTRFAVWAPNAATVSVIGDFNGWREGANALHPTPTGGVWQGFVPGVGSGATYKYAITSRVGNHKVAKADPFAFHAERPPGTASKVFDLDGYQWGDRDWMGYRNGVNSLGGPMTIYECHLGSWRRNAAEGNRQLTYRELAGPLADYAHGMGYTHVEFLPVSEHPFEGSWGYQPVGLYAPTSRFGTPHDFMYLVDTLHQKGLGVILDWVPAHFPRDEHGLAYFDGTHLYEYDDVRKREHKDWDTYVYDFGRREVANFLVANALFWLDKYHVDGLRVDAVASMLYLDYSRKPGEWVPNEKGGRENLEAVAFLKRLNERVYATYPGAVTVAEESTAWPQVSRPTYAGGLGFGLKWDMGWMHDTLRYLANDPSHRPAHHGALTFRMLYAFSENYVLPLSHDEVVYGKGSLLNKMPGDEWRKFAGLRLLFGYMFAEPGKKLLFMGGDFGQWREWNHDAALDWHLLDQPRHKGLQRWVRDLNTAYRGEKGLHEFDCEPAGFEWVDANDSGNSVLSFLRKGRKPEDDVLVVCNFAAAPRHNLAVGLPRGGRWEEVLNSDAPIYGGSGQGNLGGVVAAPVGVHGRPYRLTVTAPPLGMVAFKRKG